ncbi:hypothetical protein, partial [Streptomyces sp. NPDC029004]|uniref:hypothetical protein n=1 Tax=Streptomyces sp. NPDC029004 TaxID=3154490 RepID=UPI0033EFB272
MNRIIRKRTGTNPKRRLSLATAVASAVVVAGGVILPATAATAAPTSGTSVGTMTPGHKDKHHKNYCWSKHHNKHNKHKKNKKYFCWSKHHKFYWDEHYKCYYVVKHHHKWYFWDSYNDYHYWEKKHHKDHWNTKDKDHWKDEHEVEKT